MATETFVTVAIPTYKASEHLLCCVCSLARSSLRVEFEVCIYGDGGGDASRQAIEECRRILSEVGIAHTCHYESQNKGNTAAVNCVVEMAKSRWVFLVNDDMVFPKNWLERIVPHLKSNRVLSLPCFEPDVDGHRPASCFVSLNLGLDPNCFDFETLDRQSDAFGKNVLETGVNYPFLVEKTLFEMVGKADETFPGPYHDPDLFLRFHHAGAELVRSLCCYLYHFSGISIRFADSTKKTGKSKNWKRLEIEARINFIKKWGAKPKAKFGDVPKTKALAPWNSRQRTIVENVRLLSLLVWEYARALWLKSRM